MGSLIGFGLLGKPKVSVDGRYYSSYNGFMINSKLITDARNKKGLSIQAACDLVEDRTGFHIARPTFLSYESGYRQPSLKAGLAISLTFDLEPYDLCPEYVKEVVPIR